ncbi:MAG: hypothetical protein KatS3mg032_1831 [Cyclobacteriaceae bacterium]|nr:MAG: hypothetical protein KatS3mg032_1831 [Cyclobacteriaceae bacterium]
MSSQALLHLITGLVVVGFVAEEVLAWLNLRHMRTGIPDEIAGFYDPEKYQKSLLYHRETNRAGLIQSLFGFALTLTVLLTGALGLLDAALRQVTQHPVYLPLLFFAALALMSDVLSLPFQLYHTFVIEEKYGFNRTTFKTFVTDKLKGYMLGAVLGGSLLAVFLILVQHIGAAFWVLFLVVAAVFMLFIHIFYASLILPLFNKLTPLEDGELKTAIEQLAGQIGFPVKNILVMDGSRRSGKANAFFTGLGKRKKIVLYDTLINKHTVDELLAVLAHEIGHYKKVPYCNGLCAVGTANGCYSVCPVAYGVYRRIVVCPGRPGICRPS